MKTAVSIPEATYIAAERLASELGWSRSQLYAEAVRVFVEEVRTDDPVTVALDRVNASETGEPVNVGRQLVRSDSWEW